MGQSIISRNNPAASGDKIGDIKFTQRELGNEWVKCDGSVVDPDVFSEKYTSLCESTVFINGQYKTLKNNYSMMSDAMKARYDACIGSNDDLIFFWDNGEKQGCGFVYTEKLDGLQEYNSKIIIENLNSDIIEFDMGNTGPGYTDAETEEIISQNGGGYELAVEVKIKECICKNNKVGLGICLYYCYSIDGESCNDEILLYNIDISSNTILQTHISTVTSSAHNSSAPTTYIKFSKDINRVICYAATEGNYECNINNIYTYDFNLKSLNTVCINDTIFGVDTYAGTVPCSHRFAATNENAYVLIDNVSSQPGPGVDGGTYHYAAIYSTNGDSDELYNLDLRDGSGGPAYSIKSAAPITVDEYGSGMLIHYAYGEMDHNGCAYLYCDNENNELSKISIFNNYYENAADAPEWERCKKSSYALESKYTKAYVCRSISINVSEYYIKDITNLKSSELINLLKFNYSSDNSWIASNSAFATTKDFADASILVHNRKIYGPCIPNLNDENAYVKVK